MSQSMVRLLFLANTSQAVRSIGRLESSFGSLGGAAKLLTGALAVGLVGGLAVSVKKAVEFQSAMEKIHTQAGSSAGEVGKMSKALLKLASSVGTTPTDLAKGLFHIESAGLRGSKALEVLTAAAKGAKVGQADLEGVTNALVAAQKSGIKGAGSMAHAMGVLNATVGAGNMRMNDLTGAIATGLLPKAKAVGLSLQDVGAALGTLTTMGMHADDAATRLSMAFFQMAGPTDKAAKALKTVHMTHDELAADMRKPQGLLVALTSLQDHMKAAGLTATQQTQVLVDVFGRRSLGAVAALSQHLGDYQTRLEHINKTTKDFGPAWVATTKTMEFRLGRAKAAMEAAMIPIGNLLFPLLEKAALKVGAFAASVQQHMPQIRSAFASIGEVLGPLASGVEKLAVFSISPLGLALIAGAGSAFIFAKALVVMRTAMLEILTMPSIAAGFASAFPTLAASLGALGPVVIGVAAAVGILTAAIILFGHSQDEGTRSTNAAIDSIKRLRDAQSAAAQAEADRIAAHHQVTASLHNVAAAQKAYNDAVRQSGRRSSEATAALDTLRSAQDEHRQSILRAQAAEKADAEARAKSIQQAHAEKAKVDATTGSYQGLLDVLTTGPGAYQKFGGAAQKARVELQKTNIVDAYADSVARIARQFGATKSQANAAEAAVKALYDALQRLPTHKEVQIIVQEQRRAARGLGGAGAPPLLPPHRAAGGFIPGATGAPVDIVAHAGEIILNPRQQQTLGGPRFLADLFGFTGAEGPGFAAGGIVGKRPKERRARHTRRPKRRRPRLKTLRGIAHRDITKLAAIDQLEEDLDKDYTLKVREYDQTQEVYIVTDPVTGTDHIDWDAVSHRLGEIDDLINRRSEMLATMDDERDLLTKAINDLKRVVDALQAEIRREIAAARRDEAAIESLTDRIAAERRKKKPNRALITRWEGQRENKRTAAGHHRDRVRDLNSTVQDYARTIGDQTHNLGHILPFERRDVALDISDLQNERVSVAGTTLPTPPGGAGTGAGPNIDDLLRQIGQLKLALGIQEVQSRIIGSFQRGTLHVSETGLAMVHAGEGITPPGVPRGGMQVAGEGSPVHVEVKLANGMEWLERFIDVRVIKGTPAISRRMGREANARERSRRY